MKTGLSSLFDRHFEDTLAEFPRETRTLRQRAIEAGVFQLVTALILTAVWAVCLHRISSIDLPDTRGGAGSDDARFQVQFTQPTAASRSR